MAQTKLSAKPPEFEYVDPAVQSVRYLEHGYPSELVRWHYHDNYELHYIVESKGKTLPIGAIADDAALAKINRVVDYVMQHFKSDLPLAEVAELVGMSETAFSRFYKQATGCGFNKFVNRVRISQACELLAQTNMPITCICFETGFHNVANFNRQFLKVKHITPREYRVQIRNRA